VYHGTEAVRAFIQSHGGSRFEDISGQNPTIRDRAGFKEKVGEGWRYFIFRHVFKDEICRGYDYQAVARELIRRGFMEAQDDGSGRLTRRKRVPGGMDWFFVVLPAFFAEEKEPSE
jgi:hypothetical protein